MGLEGMEAMMILKLFNFSLYMNNNNNTRLIFKISSSITDTWHGIKFTIYMFKSIFKDCYP